LGEFGCARSGLADLIDQRSHCVRFGQLMVDEGAVAVDDREEIVEIVRHAAGESADALHFLGLHKALLRFAQRNLSLARPVSFAREPQGLPAGEHEHQCEDQRDADQADLSTPGIEERLYRCHILAGHVAPLLENPGEFALFRQHSDLLANGIGYSAELECRANAEIRADLWDGDPTQLVAPAAGL
jgi:hypothetical protein